MLSANVTFLDSFIIVGYFGLTIILGIWFGRRGIKSAEDLFLADREATWPLIGASLFSANISSQQFVGQAGLAYTIGVVAGAFQLVGAMCFVFLAVFFVDIYLSLKLRTAPEFFEKRYNKGSRIFVSGINIAMIIAGGITPALYAGATVLGELFSGDAGLGFGTAVAIIAGAAGTYTILGGLRSVLWTDLLQASLLVIGGVITFTVCLSHAGGWSAVLGDTDAQGNSMWSVVQPWDHSFGWLPLLTGAMILGVHAHCTDQDYVQRALAARSVYHSKMGALFGALLKIVALFIVATPGVLAARLLPGLEQPDQAYARLISTFVPTGLSGLVLAGLLAAILGTVAAGLSASASLVSYDFVQRIFPKLTNQKRILTGRLIMGGTLLLCAVMAPRIRSYPSVFVYLVKLWSLLAPSVFVCVVAGIFFPRATGRGAVATLVTGMSLGAVSFWLLGSPERLSLLPAYLSQSLNLGFVIAVVCATVMWLFSRNGEPLDQATAEATTWQRRPQTSMTTRERRIFRASLTGLLLIWVTVIVVFSPWGLAKPDVTEQPTVESSSLNF